MSEKSIYIHYIIQYDDSISFNDAVSIKNIDRNLLKIGTVGNDILDVA
jgi:archaeosine-15-forming tRNA-guanine transglycosylase